MKNLFFSILEHTVHFKDMQTYRTNVQDYVLLINNVAMNL